MLRDRWLQLCRGSKGEFQLVQDLNTPYRQNPYRKPARIDKKLLCDMTQGDLQFWTS